MRIWIAVMCVCISLFITGCGDGARSDLDLSEAQQSQLDQRLLSTRKPLLLAFNSATKKANAVSFLEQDQLVKEDYLKAAVTTYYQKLSSVNALLAFYTGTDGKLDHIMNDCMLNKAQKKYHLDGLQQLLTQNGQLEVLRLHASQAKACFDYLSFLASNLDNLTVNGGFIEFKNSNLEAQAKRLRFKVTVMDSKIIAMKHAGKVEVQDK